MTYIIIFITVLTSILAFNNKEFFAKSTLRPYDVVRKGEWWRVITHAFVHGDFPHLFFNMFVLWSFGLNVEHIFKLQGSVDVISNPRLTYVLLYMGGVLLAGLFDVVRFRGNPYYSSIGASAAVSAVVFTSIFYNPLNSIYLFGVIPIPGIIFGILYLVYESYSTKKTSDGINHYAHIVGAVYGFIFPLLFGAGQIDIFLKPFYAYFNLN